MTHMTKAARTRIFAAAAALTFGALPAAAVEPLSENQYINDRLVAARIADRIRKECPTIDGRLLVAIKKARALKAYGTAQGYSDAEMRAYVESRTVKDRIYAIADDYMARNGVTKGDKESYCRLGREEIARNTVSGSLLVAK